MKNSLHYFTNKNKLHITHPSFSHLDKISTKQKTHLDLFCTQEF